MPTLSELKKMASIRPPYAPQDCTVIVDNQEPAVTMIESDHLEDNPLLYMWSEYPTYSHFKGGYRQFSYEFYVDKYQNRYFVISSLKDVETGLLIEKLREAGNWNMARNVDTFVENADKEEYQAWLKAVA